MSKCLMMFLSIAFVHLKYSLLFALSAVTVPISKPIQSFCTGGMFACVVFNDNQAKCWGQRIAWGSSVDSYAEYGSNPNNLGSGLPYIDFGSGVLPEEVSCGVQHMCVKLDVGTMKCLGYNSEGQVGIEVSKTPIGSVNGYYGDTLPAVKLGSGVSVLDISLGYDHTCALVTGNKVKCFGYNVVGQLGYGDKTSRGTLSSQMAGNLPYVDLGSSVEAASLYSGTYAWHNCVIISKPTANAQRIKCWGWNLNNQLGYGDGNSRGDDLGEMSDTLPLVDLGTESKVIKLALGERHTCALRVDSVLKCFGSGTYGQLGSGSNVAISSTGNSLPAVATDSGKTIKLISGGQYFTCVVYDDMISMKCFGRNNNGQLGQGDTTDRGKTSTTLITNFTSINLGTGSSNISYIYGGSNFNCVLFADDTVKCFGDNSRGQLLIGSIDTMGDQTTDMGNNLPFAIMISPTNSPTKEPTKVPTLNPTLPTQSPSKKPTSTPSQSPTSSPSKRPTTSPTYNHVLSPTHSPLISTSEIPSSIPTKIPTLLPTIDGIPSPTQNREITPTLNPTVRPTRTPIPDPSSGELQSSNNSSSLGLSIGIPVATVIVLAGVVGYRYKLNKSGGNPLSTQNLGLPIASQLREMDIEGALDKIPMATLVTSGPRN